MVAIGIDIGGTSIKGAAVDSNGKVYTKFNIPFIKGEPGEKTIKKLALRIREYIDEQDLLMDVVGIGIGCPGTIDVDNGVVSYANNLGWEDLPVAKIMKRYLPYPVRLINDANAASFGEAKFGAGKEFQNIVMLTLGTGIGGGIIVHGKLYEGNEGKAGELGHMVICMDGEQCTCGRKGCFEAYASATALIRDAKRVMAENRDTLMWEICPNINNIGARTPFEAAQQGDQVAMELIDRYVKYLGEGILNYCNIFRPNIVVLSGGIANAGKYLFDKVNVYIKEREYGYKRTPAVEVVPSKLGYDSGIVGAAALLFE